MKSPTIARWLLIHFGCSPSNDAVIGDLDERYRRNHDRLWYWRQVIKTIAVSLVQELGSNKLRASGAVTIGWMLLVAAGLVFRSLVATLNEVVRDNRPVMVRELLSGHRDISMIGLIAMGCVLWAGVGWILNRLFRPHEKAIVLTFAMTVAAVLITVAVTISLQSPHISPRHTWASITHPFLIGISGNTFGLIFLLIGAGFAGGPSSNNRMAHE